MVRTPFNWRVSQCWWWRIGLQIQEMLQMVQSLDWEDLLEKGMATHSSILAWRISWTEESGRLQCMGSQRVKHNWATEHAHTHNVKLSNLSVQLSSVQLLNWVRLFATKWTAAHQASLSITNSQSPPKPMSIESVMPSNHLILCHPLLLLYSIFPRIRSFQMSQLFTSGGQSIGVSASTSVLPMNTQEWSPLEWTGWISLQCKGLSRDFSNTTVQKHQFFCAQLSL